MRHILSTIFLVIGLGFSSPNSEAEDSSATQKALEAALPAPAVSPSPSTDASVQIATDKSKVSVLGYHDFAHRQAATEMLLPTPTFREQLQEIKDRGLQVITMQQFLDWKHGNATLPAHSVLITIDDGWRTVYTHAYPILKEFGYPFTIYLYSDFIDTGSRSLTTKMLKEMMEHGATIGSHSTSHPYPSKVKAAQEKGPNAYQTFLKGELIKSKEFLENHFGKNITTYAYPGGYHTPEMYPVADQAGYQCLFTVKPGMVTKDSPNHTLPRHIILGTYPSSFERAMRFVAIDKEQQRLAKLRKAMAHPVLPRPGFAIDTRTPRIEVDLSGLENLDPESLVMRVAGFGKAPAVYDPESKTFSWQVQRPLRSPQCNVTVSWKHLEADSYEKPLDWTFLINRSNSYLPLRDQAPEPTEPAPAEQKPLVPAQPTLEKAESQT
ncbi:polysaccharide deacetylase family protein [Rubritalea marina]|uniref:polysaccharide deacetylase family protein n=1 Tax=Rubritalea marina TaxID=361055 RepID=UPI0014613A8D|nr:polysaccharide deacetylase family protein [Rubritalea marina]